MLGGDGNDFLYGQEGNDNLNGDAGDDVMFGNDGNDRFTWPDNNDRINGGAGVDDIFTFSNQYDFRLDQAGSTVVFTDLRGPSNGLYVGNFTTSSIEKYRVLGEDDPLPAGSLLWKPIVQRAFVQPIIVSDNDGSNTATAFGNAEQEAEFKRRVDRIYNQAGVDIVYLPTKQWNNTFANGVGGVERDVNDFGRIISQGDAAGIGSSDPTVLDYYFVNQVPGANAAGRAYVGQSGAMQEVNELFVGNDYLRRFVSETFAHELGHNFGLQHDLSSTPSVMSISESSDFLKNFQITQILNSGLTKPISGGSSNASATGVNGAVAGDIGGCGCGVCGLCTGGNSASAELASDRSQSSNLTMQLLEPARLN